MPTQVKASLTWRYLVPLLILRCLFLAACCEVNHIRTASLPDGIVGQPYAFALEHNCSGKSTTDSPKWQLSGSAPPGLTLSEEGRIMGTPVSAGTFPMEVQLLMTGGKLENLPIDTRTLSLRVRPTP